MRREADGGVFFPVPVTEEIIAMDQFSPRSASQRVTSGQSVDVQVLERLEQTVARAFGPENSQGVDLGVSQGVVVIRFTPHCTSATTDCRANRRFSGCLRFWKRERRGGEDFDMNECNKEPPNVSTTRSSMSRCSDSMTSMWRRKWSTALRSELRTSTCRRSW